MSYVVIDGTFFASQLFVIVLVKLTGAIVLSRKNVTYFLSMHINIQFTLQPCVSISFNIQNLALGL